MNAPRNPLRFESLRAHEREIDLHIGWRIRDRRLALGMTQGQMSNLIGITYQQLHKYETGKNRVAAGRLYDISIVLGVTASYFYDELDLPTTIEPSPQFRMFLELAHSFVTLDYRKQAAICAMARSMIEPDTPD